jgi:hypothetical protein
LQDPQFLVAWAKIVARAAVDADFRARVKQSAKSVFADYGVTGIQRRVLDDYVKQNLQREIESLSNQKNAQESAVEAQAADDAMPPTNPSGRETDSSSQAGEGTENPTGVPEMVSYCGTMTCTGTRATGATTSTIPCWGASTGGAQQSYPAQGGAAGSGGSTRLTGSAGTAQGAANNFNCLGTAGSLGTFCGTAGTASCFGCYVQNAGAAGSAQPMPMAQGAASNFNCLGSLGTVGTICGCGACAGTFGCHVEEMAQRGAATGGSSTRLSGTAQGAASNFNCLGSLGTVGTICGCGACAGTFGCHVEEMAQAGAATGGSSTRLTGTGQGAASNFNCLGTAGSLGTFCGTAGTASCFGCYVEQAAASTSNAGTLGSFATFGGGAISGGQPGSSTCWGTAFGS